MNTFDRAYVEDPDTMTAEEVVDWWGRLDLSRDTRFYFDAGRLAGVGDRLRARGRRSLDLDAFVHPDCTGRGLGSAMIDWLEEESRARGCAVARTSAARRRPRRAASWSPRAATGRSATSTGWLFDLDGPPPEPQWPEGFAVATLQPGRGGDRARGHRGVVRRALGPRVPRPFEEWRQHHLDRDWWDPTLVWLVREGDDGRRRARSTHFASASGWVDTIGTLEPWRGKGLGRALLLTAFGEFYRRGERRVALAVDAGNETGATHLYESVGMRVVWQADVYEKRRLGR